MHAFTENKLKEIAAKTPYRMIPRDRGKRSSGKNLYPQLTLRVTEDLRERLDNKIKEINNNLQNQEINTNTLVRYLFAEYLKGEFDYVEHYDKIMLPTDSPQLAIRQKKEITQAVKRKAKNQGHSMVSLTIWLLEIWLEHGWKKLYNN